jgi:hypothetical protein
MYYEQLFQTTEAKMNFVKGLIHISKADGVISRRSLLMRRGGLESQKMTLQSCQL